MSSEVQPAVQFDPYRNAQMKTMRDIHQKMMAAKTPQERNKLKAEHMNTMKYAMKMMDGMPSTDMSDIDSQHRMMAERMEIMQAMMNMMMDQMPATPQLIEEALP